MAMLNHHRVFLFTPFAFRLSYENSCLGELAHGQVGSKHRMKADLADDHGDKPTMTGDASPNCIQLCWFMKKLII
jgi:hypothetical protein